jgi:small GTP-binding protein
MSDEKDPTQDENQENISSEQEEDGVGNDTNDEGASPRFSPVLARGAVADPNAKKKAALNKLASGDDAESDASEDADDEGREDEDSMEEDDEISFSIELGDDSESDSRSNGAGDVDFWTQVDDFASSSDDDDDDDAGEDGEEDLDPIPAPTPIPAPRRSPIISEDEQISEDEDEDEDDEPILEEIDPPSNEADEEEENDVVFDAPDEDEDEGDEEASVEDEDDSEEEEPGVLLDLPPVEPMPAVASGADLDTEGLPVDEEYVGELLVELGEIADECGLKSLADEVEYERLPALARGRITLVVLGEFNHGKSTVVNALLGADVLPVGITPTTAVITHLVYNDSPTVTVKPPQGGESYTIPYEGMEQAVKESGAEGEEPEFVEIGYPNEVLGHSLVLVDTPGVNDISRQKVEITYGYLPRADVILYVLDATQVLKKSEVTFIRDRLLRANRDRIIFVLNKIDALSEDDIAEVEQYARERLESLIGPVELFAFSGRRALEQQRKGGELPSEFVNFRQYLMGFLQEQRAYIILDSALAGGARVSGLLEQNLAIKRQGYRLEKDELEQRIQAVRSKLKESRRLIAENTQLIDERINGIAATARHNLRIFTEQFTEQLPGQVERAEARDVKRYLPAWIQDTFKAWLEEEGQAIARSLEELAEEIIEITNESLKEAVETYREAFGLSGELDMEVDTIAYDVSVFALGAFGVGVFFFANMLIGSLLTLATPLLAFFLKEKVDAQIKERAKAEGLKAVDTASEKLEEELLRVIHDYGARLKDFVETAGDRLYRQIEEALEQVQEETQGDVDREALLAATDERLKRVRGVGHVIKTSRAQLAKWATEAGFQQAVGQNKE